MIDDLVHRQKLIIFVICIITAADLAVMLMAADVSKAAFIAAVVAAGFAVIAVLDRVGYILRLRRFITELPELPDHYFRKSSYRIDGKFYWFSDHFLDLRRIREIPYGKIGSITIFSAEYGIGSLRIGLFRKPLITIGGAYFLTVHYGVRSVRITLADNEKQLRTVLKNFTKHNNNIRVYDMR